MPVHQVVMRDGGLREVYVDGRTATARSRARVRCRRPALQAYFDRAGRHARGRLARRGQPARASTGCARPRAGSTRGFVILIDYGHEARELYSVDALRRHADHAICAASRAAGAEATRRLPPPWLRSPGEQDITAHVDFTSVRAAAEADGLTHARLPRSDVLPDGARCGRRISRIAATLKERLALKTLLLPGGLGSTMKVLLLGKERRHASAHGLLVACGSHERQALTVGWPSWSSPKRRRWRGSSRSASWNTPIAWTGFILFADGVVCQRAGDPGSASSPREFVVPGAGRRFRCGWSSSSTTSSSTTGTTSGCPRTLRCGCFGYALVVRDDLAGDFRRRRPGRRLARRRRGRELQPAFEIRCATAVHDAASALAIAAGAAMLLVAVRRGRSRYLAAPVWLGFIFLLDPINARLGAESLVATRRDAGRHVRRARRHRARYLCGVLWAAGTRSRRSGTNRADHGER